MRVVQLAGYTGPYSGSFIPMLRASLLAAAERGWETRLVLSTAVADYGWVSELAEIGVPITFLDPGSRRELPAAIGKLIADDGPTVLHSHFTRFDIPAVAAARRAGGTPVLWHIHSPQKPELAVRARNVVKYGLIGRRTFRILCVAPDIAADVRSRGGPADRVEFFPNAIDTSRFTPAGSDERVAARAGLELPEDVPIVLHFGWDWERKGGDVFLEALARLRGEQAFLGVTVGGGEPARELVGRLGLGDLVRVLEPDPDVRRLYAAADVFASTSRAEGMPFSVAEALCSGVAVVASDLPGHRAVAGEVAACRIVALEPDVVAAGIRALLARTSEVAQREADAARSSIVERLDLGPWAERLAKLHAQAAQLR